MSAVGKASGLRCHKNSPCQNVAMSPDKNVHRPCGVKIGWCHHSANGLWVQPRNWIFAAVPVKSPKLYLHHVSHAAIGSAAHRASAASDENMARYFPVPASCQALNKMAAAETASSGRLLIFVRNVAASIRPVMIPRRILGVSTRKSLIRQVNAAPKQTGDSTSF